MVPYLLGPPLHKVQADQRNKFYSEIASANPLLPWITLSVKIGELLFCNPVTADSNFVEAAPGVYNFLETSKAIEEIRHFQLKLLYLVD